MTTKLDTTEAVLAWARRQAPKYQGRDCDGDAIYHGGYNDRATASQLAQGQRLLAAWPSLFPAIAHGDEEHRAWLKDKLEAWLAAAVGEPK